MSTGTSVELSRELGTGAQTDSRRDEYREGCDVSVEVSMTLENDLVGVC